jgi:hypothetical protein
MDRQLVVGMVEDYWRGLISAMHNGGQEAAAEVSVRFEDRVQQTAALLEPLDAAAFLQTVEAERESLVAEYNANPGGLKQRLGLALGVDAPVTQRANASLGLGELAVKTAVRATVWEGIWALFRAAR